MSAMATDYSELGARLSRQLMRVNTVEKLDLIPLADLLHRLFKVVGADTEIGIGHPTKEATDAVQDALMTWRIIAYVEHPVDGRFYKIPTCYWGSFHDYRPLANGRFFTSAEHGAKALQLNGGDVFVARDLAENLWPSGNPAQRWTCDEIEKWWQREGLTDGKKARNAFMQLKDTKGLCSTFEACWRERHLGREPGRPRNGKP